MATRLVPTILAVHAALTAAPALAGKVRLGPVASGDVADAIWVGFDGNPDGEYKAGAYAANWAGLGAKKRDEAIEVYCAISSTLGEGDTDVAAALNVLDGLFDAAEDALRADPALAQSPLPFVAQLASGELTLIPNEQVGLECWLTFTVTVRTRS